MIRKEIDKKQNLKTFQKYGYEAEKQMAFYLKRAFQNNNDIHVINDLRLEMNDDVAQIDHLIIHRFGFLILESKSVTAKISINEYGEWTRHYSKNTKGMPSPINQARRQADFLKSFLMAKSEHLLKKILFFQASITDFKFDVLVAISDSGIINRAKNTEIPDVYKADQIPDAINGLLANYAGTNKNILTRKVNYQFADSSMENITTYLLQSHTPKTVPAKLGIAEGNNQKDSTKPAVSSRKTKDSAKQSTVEQEEAICSKCSSKNIEITYGRYGYYFKCNDCLGNTSIKLTCKDESCKPRIKKKKLTFYKACDECNTSEVYFENKSLETAE